MTHFAVLLCVVIAPVVSASKLHEQMTDDEVMEVFQTPRDSVPDYEVISLKHKRSVDPIIKAEFFNQSITLYLNPTDGILAGQETKVWIAEANLEEDDHRLIYSIVPDAMKDVGELYHDMKNEAAIRIRRDANGNTHFDGTIGKNHAIRPIPKRHRRDVLTANSSNVDKDGFMQSSEHIVFKIPNFEKSDRELFYPQIPDDAVIESFFSERSSQNIPEVVYPEILIFVDEQLYINLGRNVKAAVGYLLSFYNGVDLRFRALDDPKVRLNIAGIVLINSFTTFMKSYIESRHLAGVEAIEDIGRYLAEEQKQFILGKNYDLVLYMTGLDLEIKLSEDYYTALTLGLARLGTACKNESGLIEAIGMFEDNGSFTGIITAAHELAHLFNALHDPVNEPNDCKLDKGFMMRRQMNAVTENSFNFSPCSQKAMRNFFKSERAECLYNPPPKNKPLPRILPGKYMSLNDQCKKQVGTKFCLNKQDETCRALYCTNPNGGECLTNSPAAEGSPCGENKYCLNGICVSETTDSVPGLLTYL